MTAPIVGRTDSAKTLEKLAFDNTFAQLGPAFSSKVAPTPLKNPRLVSFNPSAAGLLDLDPEEATRPEFVAYLHGEKLLPGADPIAMLYAGHQFGSWVPQLGDGRAILLGEVRNHAGEKWDLQVKGSGLTPYSRMGDGRAVLRSTIREYLCSEAMHALGIPSTRALCIIGGDDPVYREEIETSAMLLRLSPSHVRFGSFEVFASRRQHDLVRQLADYVIANHYPELGGKSDRYPLFFAGIVERTARLIAKWQAVGFAHGVMNTDNMSVLGWTIDFGPFGFLDDFDPGFICNHSDYTGRYAFEQQPSIAFWNLGCLGTALLSLMSKEEAIAALDIYRDAHFAHYEDLMRAKLGLLESRPDDLELIIELLTALAENRIDYTIFFRRLADFSTAEHAPNATLIDMFTNRQAFTEWAAKYRARLLTERSADSERRDRMNRINPKFILRNYLAQNAITAAVRDRDYSGVDRLLRVLSHPFDEQPEAEEFAAPPPDWGKKIVVSCSS